MASFSLEFCSTSTAAEGCSHCSVSHRLPLVIDHWVFEAKVAKGVLHVLLSILAMAGAIRHWMTTVPALRTLHPHHWRLCPAGGAGVHHQAGAGAGAQGGRQVHGGSAVPGRRHREGARSGGAQGPQAHRESAPAAPPVMFVVPWRSGRLCFGQDVHVRGCSKQAAGSGCQAKWCSRRGAARCCSQQASVGMQL